MWSFVRLPCSLVSPRCFLPRAIPCRRISFRIGRGRNPGQMCFVIKPEEEREAVEAEVCEEDLPIYSEDSLLEEDVDLAEMDPRKRMTKIIIELVNAGGYFDEKLELYKEYLTEELLEVFYKRIEFAEKFESKEDIAGLKMIWRRVRTEVERQRASPALRLLDKLLGILHPGSGGTREDRCRQALGLMYEAFTQSRVDDVNIYELAESLSQGDPPPEDLYQELVHKKDFLQEVGELLEEVKQQRDGLLKKREELIMAIKNPREGGPLVMVLDKQLDKLEDYLRMQKRNMKDVAVLVKMAKTI